MHENGCPWDDITVAEVAKSGNLEMLKWLNECGCVFNSEILLDAVMGGNLDMIEFLYHKGFNMSPIIYFNAVHSGNLKVVKWIKKHGFKLVNDNIVCFSTSYRRYYDILKWLVKNNLPHDAIVVENIFNNGDFEMLDWIFENKFIINEDACIGIVRHNRLDILKKVKKYGCVWDYRVCELAMKCGYINIVRWLHNNGCEWRKCEYSLKQNKKQNKELECCGKKYQHLAFKKCIFDNGICRFTEKSIKKWLDLDFNKEFNFIEIS